MCRTYLYNHLSMVVSSSKATWNDAFLNCNGGLFKWCIHATCRGVSALFLPQGPIIDGDACSAWWTRSHRSRRSFLKISLRKSPGRTWSNEVGPSPSTDNVHRIGSFPGRIVTEAKLEIICFSLHALRSDQPCTATIGVAHEAIQVWDCGLLLGLYVRWNALGLCW